MAQKQAPGTESRFGFRSLGGCKPGPQGASEEGPSPGSARGTKASAASLLQTRRAWAFLGRAGHGAEEGGGQVLLRVQHSEAGEGQVRRASAHTFCNPNASHKNAPSARRRPPAATDRPTKPQLAFPALSRPHALCQHHLSDLRGKSGPRADVCFGSGHPPSSILFPLSFSFLILHFSGI